VFNPHSTDGLFDELHGGTFVGGPLDPIPYQPLPLHRAVADAVAMLVNKSFCIPALREWINKTVGANWRLTGSNNVNHDPVTKETHEGAPKPPTKQAKERGVYLRT
jgi:hypothetical protein